MHLLKTVNLIDFLQQVMQCQADVHFTTEEGDILNLKSELSRCILALVAEKDNLLSKGSIVCQNPEDELRLHNFLTF